MKLTRSKWQNCYDECIDMLDKMYKLCHIVHGDFNEYNILYYDDHCYVIDVGQGMDISHEKSDEYLRRDCEGIIKFFEGKGIEVKNIDDLINYIKMGECEKNEVNSDV